MKAWLYDPATGKAGDHSEGIISRNRIEEAAERLRDSGIWNQLLIVDVLQALSGLSKAEVRFNVELALAQYGMSEACLSENPFALSAGFQRPVSEGRVSFTALR